MKKIITFLDFLLTIYSAVYLTVGIAYYGVLSQIFGPVNYLFFIAPCLILFLLVNYFFIYTGTFKNKEMKLFLRAYIAILQLLSIILIVLIIKFWYVITFSNTDTTFLAHPIFPLTDELSIGYLATEAAVVYSLFRFIFHLYKINYRSL